MESKFQKMLPVLIGRHELIISDLIQLMIPHMKKCSSINCYEPATVQHVDIHTPLCDYHCAQVIISSAKKILSDPDDKLNNLRYSLIREEDYVDLKDAEKIRRCVDYIRLHVKSDNEVIH